MTGSHDAHSRRILPPSLVLGCLAAFQLLVPAARATEPTPARLTISGARAPLPGPRVLEAKLDGMLAQIAAGLSALPATEMLKGLHTLNPAARFRRSTPLSTPQVAIDAITTGDPLALREALQRLGLEQAAVFSNDVGGWLPVDQIERAAALPELHHARAAMPRTRAAVATQGDFAAKTAAVRTAHPNLTGAGFTIGALSDSFNCYQTYATDGVPASGYNGYAFNGYTATYANDQSTGALPASVNVVEEAPCMSYGAPYQLPFTDEGRALLQILHVVAPDASLAFYTAVNSEADFANGIVTLANDGAKIIDDDVGYPDEPFFQDGIVAQAIDQVANNGVAYFSSAGNDATNAYDNNAPSFPPPASTMAPNAGELLLNFDTTGASTVTSLPLTIPPLFPGEYVTLVVEWDQPYITGAPNSGGTTSSIDLCVTTSSGTDLITDYATGVFPNPVSCTGANPPGVDPVQILVIGNSASASGYTAQESVTISIGLANGTAPPGRIKFLLDGGGAPVSIDPPYANNSATIQGHPGAAGAVAVGAAFYFYTSQCGTSPAVLEAYSSRGGDPILFSSSGARLSAPVMRQKPDLVGPDGVNNTFLGGSLMDYGFPSNTLNTSIAQCQTNASYPSFFGTSAAAPHIAAAAALLWQADTSLTATDVISALRSTAAPMGSVPNNQSGYGFVQADAALASLPVPAPAPSASHGGGGTIDIAWLSVLALTLACRWRRRLHYFTP